RFAQIAPPASPHTAGKIGGDIFRQSEDLAGFANGAAGTVMDNGGSQRGAMMAVAPVNILDDFFTPLMLEVDVDIRRLLALLADEALEQQIHLHRIDGRDAEHVTDGGVRSRAAALT